MPTASGKTGSAGIAGSIGPHYSAVGRSGSKGGSGITIPAHAQGKTGSSGIARIVRLAYPKTASGKTGSRGQANQPQLPSPRSASGATGSFGIARFGFLPHLAGVQSIVPSAPLGVIPQIGSAIYRKWRENPGKQTTLQRYYNQEESGRAEYAITRKSWDLEVEVPLASALTHVNFIKNHFGSGIPFYFYDLQHNGFVYDATGVITSGRYKVRFDDEAFPTVVSVGHRAVITYHLIEVD